MTSNTDLVLDFDDPKRKLIAIHDLVQKLPPANYDLLTALSTFLLDVVNNSGVNKMTIRNVGIIFAPSLNIPNPLISFFLTDHDYIFLDGPISNKSSEFTTTSSSTASDIRSPRKQMFTDLSSPTFPSETRNIEQRHLQGRTANGQSIPSSTAGAASSLDPHNPALQSQYPTYHHPPALDSGGYSSLNAALAPSQSPSPSPSMSSSLSGSTAADSVTSVRKNRRESAMLGLGGPTSGAGYAPSFSNGFELDARRKQSQARMQEMGWLVEE